MFSITYLYQLITFWFYWVITAASLYLVVLSEGYSSLWCSGFSLGWLLLLQSMGSRYTGLQKQWHTDLAALGHVESSGPVVEPMFPALADGFLSNVPPEKSYNVFLIDYWAKAKCNQLRKYDLLLKWTPDVFVMGKLRKIKCHQEYEFWVLLEFYLFSWLLSEMFFSETNMLTHKVDENKMIKPDPLSVQFSSVAQSCPTPCDPMNHSKPGLPVHHQLLEFTQTHFHRVSDAIQPSHPLSSPSPLAPNPSQYQSLFQWVNSSCEVAKVLEFQL